MQRHSAFRVRRPGQPSAIDRVVEEVAVAFEYNGIAHTVMLATPDDLEDFAVGFSLTEGIVNDVTQIHDIEIETSDMGIVLRIDIAGGPFFQLKQRRRSLAGRTGCGFWLQSPIASPLTKSAPARIADLTAPVVAVP